MEKFLGAMMYVLWAFSLIGILMITFSNFQYTDLNVIVGILFFFALLNTFFTLNKK